MNKEKAYKWVIWFCLLDYLFIHISELNIDLGIVTQAPQIVGSGTSITLGLIFLVISIIGFTQFTMKNLR